MHGNLLALRAPRAAGQMMNLATGGRFSLLDLVDAINELLGMQIAPQHAAPRSGDIRHSRADITRARDLLGFEPVVTFLDGLARTIEWYRTR